MENVGYGMRVRRWATVGALVLLAGCGQSVAGSNATDTATSLRLGYFPNLTHATALVGVQSGIFQRELGTVKLEASTFNAGPAAVEALFSRAIDAAYVGPNPTITAWSRSHGAAIRVISGEASGGASLVVRAGINSAADLKGKRVADPQLSGTQDVALRYWLARQGLKTDPSGGGDVSIVPEDNGQALTAFKSSPRQVDGAWVPEPWATRLVSEGGGHVLVDERDLWPGGQFVSTNLVVRTEFLRQNPGVVEKLLRGQVRANAFLRSNTADAERAVNMAIMSITGRALASSVVSTSWQKLTFTNDPLPASLQATLDHAVEVGLQSKVDLRALYDLGPLNRVLAELGEAPVPGP